MLFIRHPSNRVFPCVKAFYARKRSEEFSYAA